jgi:hypothetical protein
MEEEYLIINILLTQNPEVLHPKNWQNENYSELLKVEPHLI